MVSNLSSFSLVLQLNPYSNQQNKSVDSLAWQVSPSTKKCSSSLGRKKLKFIYIFLSLLYVYLRAVCFKPIDCSFQREGKNSNFGLCDSEAFRHQERKKDLTERISLLIYCLHEHYVCEHPKYSTEFHIVRHDDLHLQSSKCKLQ